MSKTCDELRTLRQNLTEAVKDPKRILAEGWHLDPNFCHGFFDRCEHAALVLDPEALPLALKAVEISAGHTDSCLANRAWGVLSHAHISRADRFWAGHVLEGYRHAALVEGCSSCRSNFLLREGDLLGEEKQAAESLIALNHGLKEAGGNLTDDARARILFPRSIAYHHLGQRDLALADAGEALMLFALDSPKGFFLDSLALLAVFIGGGDQSHDMKALEYIRRFEKRIQGSDDDWKAVHTRRIWVEAHLYARLGNVTLSFRKLTSAQARLYEDGLEREIVACTLDRVQVKCRPGHLRTDNLHTAGTVIDKLLRVRPDLEESKREGLREILTVLKRQPGAAFEEIGRFRRSFVAPVRGQLGERIGPG